MEYVQVSDWKPRKLILFYCDSYKSNWIQMKLSQTRIEVDACIIDT